MTKGADGILELLKAAGALHTGHFVLKGWDHSGVFIDMEGLATHPAALSAACLPIARHFVETPVDVVLGPAEGAIPMAQWVAFHMNELQAGKRKQPVKALHASYDEEGYYLKGNFPQHVRGSVCLVIDDVRTTGASAERVVDLVHEHGGAVLAVAYIVNRGHERYHFLEDFEVFAVEDIPVESYPEGTPCPLCVAGFPIDTHLGHGKEYLERNSLT